jgi:hypothetical protein
MELHGVLIFGTFCVKLLEIYRFYVLRAYHIPQLRRTPLRTGFGKRDLGQRLSEGEGRNSAAEKKNL